MGNGVWKCDPKTNFYKNYSYKEGVDNSLSSNSVRLHHAGQQGNIWFSTDRGGICRYNEAQDDFTTFSIEDGLPDDVAYNILEDDAGNLWFGTNKGLVKFNPESKDIRVFTNKDGLLGNQFNYQSALKAQDGRFYFGGVDGLIAFDPTVQEEEKPLPPVYISKFSIYNKEVTVHTPASPLKQCIVHTDEIVLPYDQSISVLTWLCSVTLLPSPTNTIIVWNHLTGTGYGQPATRIFRMPNFRRENIPSGCRLLTAISPSRPHALCLLSFFLRGGSLSLRTLYIPYVLSSLW